MNLVEDWRIWKRTELKNVAVYSQCSVQNSGMKSRTMGIFERMHNKNISLNLNKQNISSCQTSLIWDNMYLSLFSISHMIILIPSCWIIYTPETETRQCALLDVLASVGILMISFILLHLYPSFYYGTQDGKQQTHRTSPIQALTRPTASALLV